MSFYVSYMTPVKRARIHKGSCPHCRDGKGQENQERNNSGHTGWSRPFVSLEEAETYMVEAFPGFSDIGKCGHCKPGVD